MPRNGAYTLSEAPERIRIVCAACKRDGSYNRDRLLERFGDEALPGLLYILTREAKCERALAEHGLDRCKARYHPDSIVEYIRDREKAEAEAQAAKSVQPQPSATFGNEQTAPQSPHLYD